MVAPAVSAAPGAAGEGGGSAAPPDTPRRGGHGGTAVTHYAATATLLSSAASTLRCLLVISSTTSAAVMIVPMTSANRNRNGLEISGVTQTPPCGARTPEPKAMISAPVTPPPTIEDGMTMSGCAAANGIAPSE